MMKKISLILTAIAVLSIVGCEKLEDRPLDESPAARGTVVFTGTPVNKDLKNGLETDEQSEYALITINDTEYLREIYYMNGIPYTQSIKLPPGIYSVERFLMKDDNQTPNDTTDDPITYAIPQADGDYAIYVSKPTAFDIEVEAFQKIEIPIEVLAFVPSSWEMFGFDWFVIEQSTIREQCFFGDICVDDPDEYIGSLYEGQSNGLQMDMPAIFEIEVYQNTSKNPDEDFVHTATFSNAGWLGEGAPLCLHYEDHDHYDDTFRFKLYILVATDAGFEYIHYLSWEFMDDELIENGDDGITDFVLGDCAPDADFIITFGGGSETAYAYTDDESISCGCFIDLGIGSNWGWQIGPFDTDFTFDLYAGAGQCDINNGTLVGELVVDFNDGGMIDVTYNMYSGYGLDEAQLWFDDESWLGNNISPGQFPNKAEGLNGANSYTFGDLTYDGGSIYLIAHATVLGF